MSEQPISPLGHEHVSQRALSMLRAVRDGRAHLVLSCEPDLYVDGISCCDQPAAHALTRSGLIRPAQPGSIGDRVPATLTKQGHAVLTSWSHPVASAS